MIYPKHFETKSGFDEIRQILIEKCSTHSGKLRVERMSFSSDFKKIRQLLQQTEELRQILTIEDGFPNRDYIDLSKELRSIRIPGSYLDKEILPELRDSLITLSNLVNFFQRQESLIKYPNLTRLAEPIFLDDEIAKEVDRIVDEKGEIRDSASEKLGEIRREIRRKQGTIGRKIGEAMKLAVSNGWIEKGTEPTVRNGRLVIPLASTHKRQLKGIIHDESSTGQTTFVEPAAAFETNNEIRELESAERREIIRILKTFCDKIRQNLDMLIIGYNFLSIMDFIRAKASFAREISATLPILTHEATLDWRDAVHPLLYLNLLKQNRVVVPLVMELNREHRILVISGPNAGGKSICLKTVALLQYMFQCGMLIPVKETSTVGIFKKLFIDIGDEQSLENDMSTYSSHLNNMKQFVLNADKNTLFLIDEFGTGTEPQLGGAIAEAVLEQLNSAKSFGVVTTHYANLKLLAKKQNGIINGAMLFNTRELKPLYRLSLGKPGSSFAFEIAERIGFPKNILKNAAKKTGKTQMDFDRQLQQLEIEQKELSDERRKMQITDDLLLDLTKQYDKKTKELQAQKHTIIKDAKTEAKRIIESSNKLIENTIWEIKEAEAEKEKTKIIRKKLEKEKSKLGEQLKEIKVPKPKIRKKSLKKNEKPKTKRPLKIGDHVIPEGQQVIGEILEINKEDALVSFGNFTLRTPLENLFVSPSQPPKIRRSSNTNQFISEINDRKTHFDLTLDVRGSRATEALEKVRRYIDEAVLLSIHEVRILHGTGHGILRLQIRELLQKSPEIEEVRDERVEFGGTGISIVKIK